MLATFIRRRCRRYRTEAGEIPHAQCPRIKTRIVRAGEVAARVGRSRKIAAHDFFDIARTSALRGFLLPAMARVYEDCDLLVSGQQGVDPPEKEFDTILVVFKIQLVAITLVDFFIEFRPHEIFTIGIDPGRVFAAGHIVDEGLQCAGKRMRRQGRSGQ